MDSVFQRIMAELPTQRDLLGVQSLLERELGHYGVRMFAYLSFVPGGNTDEVLALTTYPPTWVKSYCSNRYDRIDPIIARSIATTLPFTWSIRTGCSEPRWSPSLSESLFLI